VEEGGHPLVRLGGGGVVAGTIETDVLVIGGGATGAGVVRDAAMRGFRAVLVERVDLGQGTSGRYHGLLHSGARYVVTDPVSARECADENAVLRRVAAGAIEATGGLFVTTPFDDPAYADGFLAACAASGVRAEEVDAAEALRREPRLHPGITRAFAVDDASLDIWLLLWANARSAERLGARILTYHWVTEVLRDGDAVAGVVCRDDRTGEQVRIEAGFTVNATGVWADELATMAGCRGIGVVPGRGIMIAMAHRLVNTVVNRCDLPGDGDILVPIRTVSVIGTTDTRAEDPDDLSIPAGEVQAMLDAGEQLVPGFRGARALHVWVGARPLVDPETDEDEVEDTHHLSRDLALIDHARRDGVRRFLTITGGKATTYRLMAELTMDAVCRQLGEARPCRTAEVPLDGFEEEGFLRLGDRLARQEDRLLDDQLVCECELVPRRAVRELVAREPRATLDDLRRALRVGMGPCQGGFCGLRATGILHEEGGAGAARASELLARFLAHRWSGIQPILSGDQMRQAVLDEWIAQGLLDVGHLPGAAEMDLDRA
jgi:glycerol-3-phosphate dehydrogenase